ncbi:hypothetical protein GOP47_0004800 [Adiantum capillus-veneris]|uniref:Uncharacterized protein n=1 Tax=Adiantum capillus-veneris TaxID=13818 RepID=A0A9D4V3Y6_ADICA|nr:hypothetical protein GOP47_0004800 [Adiantum capillus-veneris]
MTPPDHVEDLQRRRIEASFKKLDAMDVHGWRAEHQHLKAKMEGVCRELESMHMNVSITQVAGGSAVAAGGAMAMLGAALAPFTFGITLPLVAAGAALGAAGGLTTAGGHLTQKLVSKARLDELRHHSHIFCERTRKMQYALDELLGLLQKLQQVMHPRGIKLISDVLPMQQQRRQQLDVNRIDSVLKRLLQSGKFKKHFELDGPPVY